MDETQNLTRSDLGPARDFMRIGITIMRMPRRLGDGRW